MKEGNFLMILGIVVILSIFIIAGCTQVTEVHEEPTSPVKESDVLEEPKSPIKETEVPKKLTPPIKESNVPEEQTSPIEESEVQEEQTSQFDFNYSFGPGRNILDTRSNFYVKDMICVGEPLKEYNFQLSESEKTAKEKDFD